MKLNKLLGWLSTELNLLSLLGFHIKKMVPKLPIFYMIFSTPELLNLVYHSPVPYLQQLCTALSGFHFFSTFFYNV